MPSAITADASTLRRRAMDLLARREHSEAELQDKLRQRFPASESETITAVIARLREQGLQSDERFAESFVRSRQQRGQGPVLIAQQLRQRGLLAEHIDELMQDSDDTWIEILSQVIRRRCHGVVPADRQQRQKLQAFCYRRGFSADQIRLALKRVSFND